MHGGLDMPGGPENRLDARALYLWQGSKDTLYRIHGTNEPWTIGQSVSAGLKLFYGPVASYCFLSHLKGKGGPQ